MTTYKAVACISTATNLKGLNEISLEDDGGKSISVLVSDEDYVRVCRWMEV